MDIIHQHFKINFRNHFVKVQAERRHGLVFFLTREHWQTYENLFIESSIRDYTLVGMPLCTNLLEDEQLHTVTQKPYD